MFARAWSSLTKLVLEASWLRDPRDALCDLSVCLAFELASLLWLSKKVVTLTFVVILRSGDSSVWVVEYDAQPVRPAAITTANRNTSKTAAAGGANMRIVFTAVKYDILLTKSTTISGHNLVSFPNPELTNTDRCAEIKE
jgi:hypothetical protein